MAQDFRRSKYGAAPAPVATEKTFVDAMPRIQWATRWELQEFGDDGEPVRKSGWVFKRGENKEMDKAAAALNLPWFSYKHQNGGATIVYWHLREAHFYFAITGVISDWDMKKDIEARTGFAYARKDHGNGDTVLRIVGFCEELYDAGFKDPICIQVTRRTAFQDLLRILTDHYRALEKFAELRGSPGELPAFYEVAVGIGTGKPEKRGTTQTALVVPPASLLPQQVTREYLLEHYINRKHRVGLFDAIEEPGDDGTILIQELLAWAVADSKRIDSWTNDQEGVAGADPEATSYMTKGGRQAQGKAPQNTEDLPF